MSMKYISTRGGMDPIGFQEAVLTGLAPDGGLLLPQELPETSGHLKDWSQLSYKELAFEILRLFVDIPDGDLQNLIEQGYKKFRHNEIAPLVKVDDFYVQELFHGPTLAFKDIALQLLGPLFSYILEQRGGELNVLGATSGDTGSAAIHGLRGRKHIKIFVMHPRGRVSPLQEKQMTSVLDENVFNLAIEGNFDDCQNIMKSIFGRSEFKKSYSLGSVNSVNWARVLAQMVYYFYATFRAQGGDIEQKVQFSVPTGNFGDILAGYLATRMGLPIEQLILATNENDILSRFFNSNEYSTRQVVSTLSPSMDIQVASNFERYLYYRVGSDPHKIRSLMEDFSKRSRIDIAPLAPGEEVISAANSNTTQTLETIRKYKTNHAYLLDPHSAVGVHVAERKRIAGIPLVCLATAHPAKFSQAIIQATGEEPHHPILDALKDAPTRCENLPNDEVAVRQYLQENIKLT